MFYLTLKAIHLSFMVCWMAGLFYIVRLFAYHREANDKAEFERQILQNQFKIMEARLWKVITVPSMVITVITGLAMLYLNTGLLNANWMMVKLCFAGAMLAYHWVCGHLLTQLKNQVFKWSSMQLRLWNELATLLFLAIVFTVVLQGAMVWLYGIIGFILIGLIFTLAVKVYKLYRIKNKLN